MKAPYKRGQKLVYQHPAGAPVEVKYVRWWGVARSSLIVVRFQDGQEKTVHVDEVKPVAG